MGQALGALKIVTRPRSRPRSVASSLPFFENRRANSLADVRVGRGPFREAKLSASRPFPLPQDLAEKHARPGLYLYRAAASYLRAGANRSGRLTAEGAARQLFAGDTLTAVLIQRAAAVPATTTGPGWADALVGRSVFDAIQIATSVSAAATLIGQALHVDLTGVAAVVVPGRIIDAAHAGAWVAESAAIPVTMLNFSSVVLEPRKLAVIGVFTREMSESSNIENVVKQTLGEASGLALDAAMFSNAPGDPARPPGLLNGIAPLTPAPAGPNAMALDLAALINALAANSAGASPTIIAASAQAFAIKLSAGPHFDIPVLSAPALATASPARTVIMIETSSLVVGFDPTPEFFVSKAGALHFEDATPSTATLASPTRSMFQTDSLALKMIVRASWAMRAPHAAWLTNVNWP